MFNFFKKRNLELEDQSVATVTFKVDPFNEVDVTIDWISDEDSIGVMLATLLYNINNGNYSDSIIDILSNAMQEDKDSEKFIRQTLFNLKAITKLQTSKETPVVRPSDFSYSINKNEE
jgi:hypothetical protein